MKRSKSFENGKEERINNTSKQDLRRGSSGKRAGINTSKVHWDDEGDNSHLDARKTFKSRGSSRDMNVEDGRRINIESSENGNMGARTEVISRNNAIDNLRLPILILLLVGIALLFCAFINFIVYMLSRFELIPDICEDTHPETNLANQFFLGLREASAAAGLLGLLTIIFSFFALTLKSLRDNMLYATFFMGVLALISLPFSIILSFMAFLMSYHADYKTTCKLFTVLSLCSSLLSEVCLIIMIRIICKIVKIIKNFSSNKKFIFQKGASETSHHPRAHSSEAHPNETHSNAMLPHNQALSLPPPPYCCPPVPIIPAPSVNPYLFSKLHTQLPFSLYRDICNGGACGSGCGGSGCGGGGCYGCRRNMCQNNPSCPERLQCESLANPAVNPICFDTQGTFKANEGGKNKDLCGVKCKCSLKGKGNTSKKACKGMRRLNKVKP